MAKFTVTFDSTTAIGKALTILAGSHYLPISKANEDEQPCPIAPTTLKTSADLMNLGSHVRCRLLNLQRETESINQLLKRYYPEMKFSVGNGEHINTVLDEFALINRARISAVVNHNVPLVPESSPFYPADENG